VPFIHEAVFRVINRCADVAICAFRSDFVVFITRRDRDTGNATVRRFVADFLQPANTTILQQRIRCAV
jgi:hypothetical protein